MSRELRAKALLENLNRLFNDSMEDQEDRDDLVRECIVIFNRLPAVQAYFDKLDAGSLKEDVNLEFLLLMMSELGFKRINNRIRPRTRSFLKYLDQQKKDRRIKI